MTYQNIPFLITAFFVLIMSFAIIYLIRIVIKDKREKKHFEKQLAYNIDPLKEDVVEESKIRKKMKVLPELMIKAEIVEKTTSVQKLTSQLGLLFGIFIVGGTILTRNPLAGITMSVFAYFILFGISTMKINKIRNLMDEQIPGFISTFKANMQSDPTTANE